MASSDDEGETLPDSVSDYYFYDEDDEPLSFSKLPVQWNESDSSSSNAGPIFLGGMVDNGLRKFYQKVKAWKYDILTATPKISVLSKDNHWIKLKKPRKSYEKLIRSILISVHCLCFFKSKPEAPVKSLWDHLSKVFSLYDVRPSENDLINHINFIREAVKRDETLAKSKFLAAFLENPRKKNSPDEDVATKPSFIVDDINGETQEDDMNQAEDSESDGEEDPFDPVCAICDNGGKITCCEGKCFRSFHTTPDSEEAQDSNCESLCLPPEELEGEKQLICENCQYNLHQCYVCGELGSSDKSKNPEVFRCSSATCGLFYHPKCVAKLIQKNDKTEQQTLKENIAAGEPFICPAHKCAVCKETENEKVKDLQFAICRRCPKSYHRKCLPRDILFEHQIDEDDDDADIRAWDGLLTKSRALIYCLQHEIDPDLATPVRTIIFRNILRKAELSSKKKLSVKVTGGDSVPLSKKNSVLKTPKEVERPAIKPEGSFKKRPTTSSAPEALKKRKIADASKNPLRKSLSTAGKKPGSNDGQPTLGSRLFEYFTGGDSNKLVKDEVPVDDKIQTAAGESPRAEILPPIDDESKQRIVAMMKEAASSVKLDEVKKYHQRKVPSTHAQSSRVDKSIILARVEGSVEALNLALKKLEEGCSVQDAMAVCDPGDIDQLLRWKDKLKVYLAPFLHGMRYTSFGRHFTKVEKLEKIVDKLHWYIEDGDTIVDFCCGANDFSCLMKKKLDETGKKKCSYKNYDIAPPKNDFNFEKRDWMKVSPKELPSGNRLVMGLNPPFGRNAALANKFVDSALVFKPKLIILIVPPETEKLNHPRRKVPYDLVWEDLELLAGKSFYLPGSVDANDKQMEQWNLIAPPLYLWSRPDWTEKHRSIAQQQGHIPRVQPLPQSDENGPEPGITVGEETKKKEDGLSVKNEDSVRTPSKAKTPNSKKRKKGKASGSETKSKQNTNKGKGKQNSSKKNRVNHESKTEKRDDQAQKVEKPRAPVEPQKLETQTPVEPKKRETERPSVEAPKREAERAPVEAPKRETERAPIQAPKRETERALVQAQKRETATEAQKLEIERAPVEAQKRAVERAPAEAQKEELTRVPPRENEVRRQEVTSVPSRETEAHKREQSRAPSRETEDYEKRRSRETEDYEKRRATPRENEYQKHEKARASPRTREDKYESKRPSPHTREDKYESKRPSPRTREEKLLDTSNVDFSFVDVDQQLDGRYNSALDESTFSLQNDLGQSFDQYIERKYGSGSDDLYTGSTVPVPRRPDGANHGAPPGYSRPDHLPFPPGYDRGGSRGSYYDEPGPRTGGSGYSMARQEPGLTRYGTDAAPYNRSSTSATQRYAPRLDELNHTRVNSLGRSELDEMSHLRMSGMGRPEPPPPIGSRGVGGYHLPVSGPGFRVDSLGFAPGPHHQYQHNSSGGWLNE